MCSNDDSRMTKHARRTSLGCRRATRRATSSFVIRFCEQTPFVIFVSFDVMDGQTMRHFDQNGHEEFLPSETQPLPPADPFPFDGGS